jgi:hypothetical protein
MTSSGFLTFISEFEPRLFSAVRDWVSHEGLKKVEEQKSHLGGKIHLLHSIALDHALDLMDFLVFIC